MSRRTFDARSVVALTAAGVVSAALSAPRPARAAALADEPRVRDAARLYSIWAEEQIAYHGIPGVAVGVVSGDALVWAQGYGVADLESREPVTPATLFRLGSVSKTFTATAILLLRDDGELALDDPLVKHLSWFSIGNPFPGSPAITLRHLLTHTAGLPREGAFPYWTTHVFPSREELRRVVPTQSLVNPPGEIHRYSNLGVALLGEVVQEVSGLSYEEFLRRRIFGPLGMAASTSAPSQEVLDRLARAYQRRRPDGSRDLHLYYDTASMAPMSAVISNVEELARFAAMHLGDGPAGGRRLLSGWTLGEMHRPQFLYPSWSGARGLVFGVSKENGTTFVSHGGWIGGHRSQLLLAPEKRLAVVAMTNADDASPYLFARRAYELVGGAIAALTAPARPAKPPEDPAWQALAGLYTDPWGWEYEVLVLDGELVMYEHDYPPSDAPESSLNRLQPTGPNQFLMGDGEPVVFELGADGRVERIRRRYEYLTPVAR